MSLREELKDWIPMYLWEKIEHPEGYVVSNEEFNARWNMAQVQGDQQADAIKNILNLLFGTILHDEDGASHIKINLSAYPADNVKDVLRIVDQRQKANAQALTDHKSSADHDARYYTKVQLDAGQLNNLYYTKLELNQGQLDNRYYRKDQLNNGQLDNRYYTKEELIPWLRGGDTDRREEVFTIVNPDNGDRTFSYTSGERTVISELTEEGHQVFKLEKGVYEQGSNRLEVFINDTLRRSVVSGGIIETSNNSFILTAPEEAGAEVTVLYYERLGMAAEYNIKMSTEKPPSNEGKTMWFKLLGQVTY